jgi:hypothetical protein
MRKYLPLLMTSILFALATKAQVVPSFYPFKVELGGGLALGSSGSKGMLVYVEPSYTIAGKYKPGLRLEQNFQSMKNTGSSALTFDYYYFKKPGFRLFVGGGYGFFNSNSAGGCDPGPTTMYITSTTKKTGGMVRMGLEAAHFRLGIEYNMAPSTYVTAVGNPEQTSSTVEYKNGYLGIKMGILIGGGIKR